MPEGGWGFVPDELGFMKPVFDPLADERAEFEQARIEYTRDHGLMDILVESVLDATIRAVTSTSGGDQEAAGDKWCDALSQTVVMLNECCVGRDDPIEDSIKVPQTLHKCLNQRTRIIALRQSCERLCAA